MLDGYKTYIVAGLVAVAAVASYFGSFTPNQEIAAALLGIAGVAYSLRKAIEKQK